MKTDKRFMCNPTAPGCNWTDKWTAADLARDKGWIDCTDMSDKAFAEFLSTCYPECEGLKQLAAQAP